MSNPFRFVWAVRRCSAGRPFLLGLGAALGGELLDVATTEDENARPDGQDALGLEIAAGDHAGDGRRRDVEHLADVTGKHLVVSGSHKVMSTPIRDATQAQRAKSV